MYFEVEAIPLAAATSNAVWASIEAGQDVEPWTIDSLLRRSQQLNMSQTTAYHRFTVACIAVLMLAYGGCASPKGAVPCGASSCCWQIVDAECYGYYPTCWRTWSEACEMCIPPNGVVPKSPPPEMNIPAPSESPAVPSEFEEIKPPVPAIPEGNTSLPEKPVSLRDPAKSSWGSSAINKEPFFTPAPPILQNPQAGPRPESLSLNSVQLGIYQAF